jgi:uncharacterized protein YjbJ (UPF0337 family)
VRAARRRQPDVTERHEFSRIAKVVRRAQGEDGSPTPVRRWNTMSKAKNKAKQMKGKMKEATGKSMDDRSMEGEGRGEQMTGKAEELKDRAAGQMKGHMDKSGR